MNKSSDERAKLTDEIDYWLNRWRKGQKAWSFAYHVSLFGAAIISVAIGFILQLQSPLFFTWSKEGVSTVLAFTAAALSAVAAAGGFEGKWRANRLSRRRLDELRIDFMDSHADLHNTRDRLKSIIRMHDDEILGAGLQAVSSGGGSPSGQEPRGGAP